MMRSIFILFLMLQWTGSCFADEHSAEPSMMNIDREKYMETSSDDSSDSSMEELTTTVYESLTETNPPIVTQAPTSTKVMEESTSTTTHSPMLMKLVAFEPTEAAIEVVTEDPVVESTVSAREPTRFETAPAVKKATSKSIKPRLLDTETDEIVIKTEHRGDETLEAALDEDTTPVNEIESEVNDTVIEIADEDTTVQPPTSKKPKKIEIYKTRPNELLKHYVEDSHLRSPVAALIDKKTNPLTKAKKLWKAALRPNALLDIMVVSYDSEGEITLQPV